MFPPAIYTFTETLKVICNWFGLCYIAIDEWKVMHWSGRRSPRRSNIEPLVRSGWIPDTHTRQDRWHHEVKGYKSREPSLNSRYFLPDGWRQITMYDNVWSQRCTWLWRADHNAAGKFGGLGIDKVKSLGLIVWEKTSKRHTLRESRFGLFRVHI